MTDALQPRRDQIIAFFQRLADAFLSGDHEWLAGVYMYPLAVYVEGEIFLERDPKATIAALFARREKALLAGSASIRSEVLDIGEPVDGRFPVRVNWFFLSETGREVGMNELRYYCRLVSEDAIKIEILEFIRRGFEKPGRTGNDSLH